MHQQLWGYRAEKIYLGVRKRKKGWMSLANIPRVQVFHPVQLPASRKRWQSKDQYFVNFSIFVNTSARTSNLTNFVWFMSADFGILLLLLASATHLRVLASSFLRFRDQTQWHNPVCKTPLDEWSARRRDLYLTAHTTLTTHKHPCPPAGFEAAIPAG
jgi:hypothetical protein